MNDLNRMLISNSYVSYFNHMNFIVESQIDIWEKSIRFRRNKMIENWKGWRWIEFS